MKHLKMLCLGVVVALSLISVAGVSTAPATTLFTDSAKTVSYPSFTTTFQASLVGNTSTAFTANGGTAVTCTQSLIHGFLGMSTGETVSFTAGEFNHGGCSGVTSTVTKGGFDIKWTGGNNGELWGTENQITISIFGVPCVYGTGEATKLGFFTGGSAPVISIAAAIKKTSGGFLCPAAVSWDAQYVVTAPHSLFVGA
jgi:hypothetical protein